MIAALFRPKCGRWMGESWAGSAEMSASRSGLDRISRGCWNGTVTGTVTGPVTGPAARVKRPPARANRYDCGGPLPVTGGDEADCQAGHKGPGGIPEPCEATPGVMVRPAD